MEARARADRSFDARRSPRVLCERQTLKHLSSNCYTQAEALEVAHRSSVEISATIGSKLYGIALDIGKQRGMHSPMQQRYAASPLSCVPTLSHFHEHSETTERCSLGSGTASEYSKRDPSGFQIALRSEGINVTLVCFQDFIENGAHRKPLFG